MESIYRRHHYSITALIYLLVHSLIIPSVSGQVTDQHKEEISTFIVEKYPNLLNLSKDYSSLGRNTIDLRSSLEREIKVLDFKINDNAIVEYDYAENDGQQIVISDKVLSFLINYSGKSYGTPAIEFECIVARDENIEAYYSSSNEVSQQSTLRKMIFREVNENLELRRVSFSSNLPEECRPNTFIEQEPTAAVPSPTEEVPTNEPPTISPEPPLVNIPRVSIPSIEISEARYINGEAYIYGFVRNFKSNGRLTDLNLNSRINVSERDGYFAIKRPMTSNGYRELKLRYDYGPKFIKDQMLLFIKTN